MLLNYNYVHQEINLKVESPIATHINIQGEKIEKQIKKCFEKNLPFLYYAQVELVQCTEEFL